MRARGAAALRLRPALHREVRRPPPPRRVPGDRRRHVAPAPGGARLLRAAAQPEDRRDRPQPLAHPAAAHPDGSGGAQHRSGRRPHLARDRRIPRRGRRFLLHGSEPAPAGRAHGDGAGHRHRPRRHPTAREPGPQPGRPVARAPAGRPRVRRAGPGERGDDRRRRRDHPARGPCRRPRHPRRPLRPRRHRAARRRPREPPLRLAHREGHRLVGDLHRRLRRDRARPGGPADRARAHQPHPAPRDPHRRGVPAGRHRHRLPGRRPAATRAPQPRGRRRDRRSDGCGRRGRAGRRADRRGEARRRHRLRPCPRGRHRRRRRGRPRRRIDEDGAPRHRVHGADPGPGARGTGRLGGRGSGARLRPARGRDR